ncbi:glycan biosynthesis hexose transferase WsfD [Paenibacillus sp. y28]|uniref:glycan biosynthesis hexose transferase WsfD n=1 Tax=Paenibacillus sp. y28 TaxID=3129110 RepID=UPI003063066B
MRRRWLSQVFSWEGLTIAAAAAVLIIQLFIPPLIGLADNGDFERVMRTSGLDYDPNALTHRDRFFGYMSRWFALVPFGHGAYVSTQLPIIWLARGMAVLFGSQALLDVRYVAGIYTALLLAACFLLLRSAGQALSRAAAVLLGILLVLVFTDVGYAAYFNSLYGEPASLMFLLLTLALALRFAHREGRTPGGLLFVAAAGLLLVGAKVQNAPIGLVLALLLLRLGRLQASRSSTAAGGLSTDVDRALPVRRMKGIRHGCGSRLAAACAGVLALMSAGIFLLDAKEIRVINLYQSVFTGILKDSPLPERDLEQLGLDARYTVLAGTDYFQSGTAIPQRDPDLTHALLSNISVFKVASFYATHPQHLLDKLNKSAQAGKVSRPGYLGNYERGAGKEYGAITPSFDWWSGAKQRWLPGSFAVQASFFGLWLAGWGLERLRAKGKAAAAQLDVLLVIPAVAVLQFVVPFLGSGEADLSKHLFLFTVCLDLMLITAAVWGVHRLVRRVRPAVPSGWLP